MQYQIIVLILHGLGLKRTGLVLAWLLFLIIEMVIYYFKYFIMIFKILTYHLLNYGHSFYKFYR